MLLVRLECVERVARCIDGAAEFDGGAATVGVAAAGADPEPRLMP
jgi:hypothetical protein